MTKRWLLTLTALTTGASPAFGQVAYHVDFTDPVHHRAQVSATFPAAAGDTLDVKMPDWRTGAYEIRDLANGVSQFRASDANGNPLAVTKIDKQTWRIARGAGPVEVSYELYANELTKRTRHIDDSHAYLDASATFVYADAHRGEPVTVTLDTPEGWRSFSGMTSSGTNGFAAPNFDVLIDSPIETGINESREFTVAGKGYTVVTWGNPHAEIDKIAGDLETMVAAAVPGIWDAYPFDRYVFMVHGTDEGGGATEHMNSTVIQLPRAMYASERGYGAFLSTAAHEFVHTWNVKAYRPDAMVPYDYDRPNYNTLLWVAEGSTSYLTEPLLLKAGLIDTDAMLGEVASLIQGNRMRPGRLVQSVSEASFDEWISPDSQERAQNDWVNIYSEGQMVSWMLDMALLNATDGKVAYRDVHEALWQRAKAGEQGYSELTILQILREKTGYDWSEWWAKHVHAPVDPQYRSLLATVGLEMIDKPMVPTLDARFASAPGIEGRPASRIAILLKDGPAWKAGLVDGDVIMMVDGEEATPDAMQARIAGAKEGDTLVLKVSRRGDVLEIPVTVGLNYDGAPTVRPMASASERQKALFTAWLGVPFPTAE